MAYSNGRIYVDTSVTPNVGVSIGDLQQCFAVIITATVDGQTVRRLSGDLGVHCKFRTGDTFTAKYVKPDGTVVNNVTWRVESRREINPWAKYKPIEYMPGSSPVVAPLTEAQRASVNYGIINIPVWSGGKRLGHVVNFWTGADTAQVNRPNDYADNPPAKWWTNQLPTSAFRLTDFSEYPTSVNRKGYLHTAKPYVGMMEGNAIVVASNGSVSINFEFGKDGVTAGLSLSYSDLSLMTGRSYQNLYFGAVIVIGSAVYFITQENTVGEINTANNTLWALGAVVAFTVKPSSYSGAIANNGSAAKVFPVLFSSAVRYEQGKDYIRPADTNLSGTFIALADAKDALVSITFAEAIIQDFYAYRNPSASTRYIYYGYTLKNASADVAHNFQVTVEMLDSNGQVLTSKQTTHQVSGNGTATSASNASIDAYPGGTNYYNIATHLRLTVTTSTTDTAVFSKTTTAAAAISSDLPQGA